MGKLWPAVLLFSPTAQREYVIHLRARIAWTAPLATSKGQRICGNWIEEPESRGDKASGGGPALAIAIRERRPLLPRHCHASGPQGTGGNRRGAAPLAGHSNPANFRRARADAGRLAHTLPYGCAAAVEAGGNPGGRRAAERAIDYGNEFLHGSRRADSIWMPPRLLDYFQYPQAMDQVALYRRISRSPYALSYEAGRNL